MERLAQTSQDMELWWDSSPLIYEVWASRAAEAVPEGQRNQLRSQLASMWNEEADPGDWVFRGVTTNPPLTRAAFRYLGDEGASLIREVQRNRPSSDPAEVAWEVYKEVARRGARRYLPLFEESWYKYGYVCAQVDPRLYTDAASMVRQGLELRGLEPNIMVKVPASRAGVAAICLLTAMGVPTNATLSFTLPQIMAVARAVSRGKQLGADLGTDYSRWRSVITFMIGRFEDAATFQEQAAQVGIQLTDELKRWSGIAIAEKARILLREKGYPCKLLIASSRVGPTVEGRQRIWHIERLAGRDLVYTMNPELIQSFMLLYSDCALVKGPDGDELIPRTTIEQLSRVPYFARAYSEDGIPEDEFASLDPFVAAYSQFARAMEELESYAQTVLSA